LTIYKTSKDLKEYFHEKEGIVAMGDRAGTLSFMIDNPMIHTEGLIMDRNYLDMIGPASIKEIMDHYQVRYYIASNPIKTDKGWVTTEPFEHHEKIKVSRDTLNLKPQLSIVHDNWRTYVFEIVK
jgi:hypothetical protein